MCTSKIEVKKIKCSALRFEIFKARTLPVFTSTRHLSRGFIIFSCHHKKNLLQKLFELA